MAILLLIPFVVIIAIAGISTILRNRYRHKYKPLEMNAEGKFWFIFANRK